MPDTPPSSYVHGWLQRLRSVQVRNPFNALGIACGRTLGGAFTTRVHASVHIRAGRFPPNIKPVRIHTCMRYKYVRHTTTNCGPLHLFYTYAYIHLLQSRFACELATHCSCDRQEPEHIIRCPSRMIFQHHECSTPLTPFQILQLVRCSPPPPTPTSIEHEQTHHPLWRSFLSARDMRQSP